MQKKLNFQIKDVLFKNEIYVPQKIPPKRDLSS